MNCHFHNGILKLGVFSKNNCKFNTCFNRILEEILKRMNSECAFQIEKSLKENATRNVLGYKVKAILIKEILLLSFQILKFQCYFNVRSTEYYSFFTVNN